MKKDEKRCTQCAEIIKLDALTCKHCQTQFSVDQIEKEKIERADARAVSTRRRRITRVDNELVKYVGVESPLSLKGQTIKEYLIGQVAANAAAPEEVVEERLNFYSISKDTSASVQSRLDWDADLTAAVDSAIQSHVRDGVVAQKDILKIERDYDVRDVETRTLLLGLSHEGFDGKIQSPKTRGAYLNYLRKKEGIAVPKERADPATISCLILLALIAILIIGWIIQAASGPSKPTGQQIYCSRQGITCDKDGYPLGWPHKAR